MQESNWIRTTCLWLYSLSLHDKMDVRSLLLSLLRQVYSVAIECPVKNIEYFLFCSRPLTHRIPMNSSSHEPNQFLFQKQKAYCLDLNSHNRSFDYRKGPGLNSTYKVTWKATVQREKTFGLCSSHQYDWFLIVLILSGAINHQHVHIQARVCLHLLFDICPDSKD